MKKRKCMASGGTVRTPQTMAEQLAKMAPRRFADGLIPGVIRDGNSFRDDPAYAAQQRHSANAELERLSTPVAIPNATAVPAALPVSAPLSGATQALPPVHSIAAPPTALGNVFANPSAGNVLAPAGGAQTFAERSLAAGINPNATYRAGGPGDPHASGGLAATAAQRIAGSNATATALAANQQAPQVDNPMDTTSTRQRRQTRTPGLQDGGRVGYRRGNEFSDRPMTGTIGTQSRDPVATTPKPKQQIAEPVYPQERNQMPQQPGRNAGSGMTSAADLGAMLAERRRQISRESGMADGGMVRHRFEGKGGPRDDRIPVTVAGEKIKVSDGEEAVILPAKTAQNPQAIAQIGMAIQQSNDGRAPDMGGLKTGGKYASGVYNRFAYAHSANPADERVAALYDQEAERMQGVDVMNVAQAVGGVPASPSGMAKAAQQATYSNEGRPSGILANNGPSPDLSQGAGAITHPSGAVDVNMGRGFDPTKLTMAPGTGMISNAAGRTLIANDMSPNQYVGADGKPGQTWEKTAQYADAMRRAQADRERLVRIQAENAVADLASPRPDVRATAERQLQAIGQLQGIESQSLAQAGQRQAVAANNPAVAQQLAQQRVGMGDIDLQNKIELNALYAAHQAAKTPEEQAQIAEVIRVRTGKDKQDEFAHAAGGTTINPETMGVEKTPDVIYSKRTGQSPGAKAATTQQYAVKPGMTVQAPDGVHTFQGKTITVKAGKVVEVK